MNSAAYSGRGLMRVKTPSMTWLAKKSPCNLAYVIHRRRLLFFFLVRRTNSHPISLPLEVSPLNTARGSGERCKLPQWGLGAKPAADTIWCILASKSAALVAAVFADFSNNKCKFLHKTSLLSYGVTICIIDCQCSCVQFLTGRRPMKSFSPGALPYGSWRVWPISQLNSTENYGRRCLTPLSPHRNYILS